MYDIIKFERGKQEIVFTGSLSKANARLKALRKSRRGDNVKYEIHQSFSSAKFQKVRKDHKHQ